MKIRVGVIFGGVSVEHEVSVISALQAFHAIDTNRYEAVPVFISKKGDWYTGEALTSIDEYKDMPSLLNKVDKIYLTKSESGAFALTKAKTSMFGKKIVGEIDVAFPVIHGTNGEDGSLQGYLEQVGIPYVGCDVLSSAVGMDKIHMKHILRSSNLPVVAFEWFYSKEWMESSEALMNKLEANLTYPMIVKPANLGSSVGISKVDNRTELEEAIELALSFANKILVEKAITKLKEVNCSVLGDYENVEASVLEEVMGSDEILSYADKYQNDPTKGMSGTSRKIPADLTDEMTTMVQTYAKDTFLTLGCSGVSRIDFLIDDETQEIFVNEINTIPGSLSFYLWEPTGKDFTQLTSDLIALALKRKREREAVTFSYDSNLFSLHGGSKGAKFGVKGK